jgi:hypothetical protein
MPGKTRIRIFPNEHTEEANVLDYLKGKKLIITCGTVNHDPNDPKSAGIGRYIGTVAYEFEDFNGLQKVVKDMLSWNKHEYTYADVKVMETEIQ